MNNSKNKLSLSELREQIDSIDTEIFGLLIRRLGIVKQVGEVKKSTDGNKSIIRPAREAQMLRNIFKRAKENKLPDNIAFGFAYIWRQIISVSINYEENTDICFLENNKCGLNKAKEYLGIFSKYTDCKNYNEAFDRVESGKSNIAIMPVNELENEKPWWAEISEKHYNLSIFAGFPFFQNLGQGAADESHSNVKFVALSNITPEPSGNDIFVYVAKGSVPKNLQDGFEVVSEYKDFSLLFSAEQYSEHHKSHSPKFNLKYLGCFALMR